MKNIKRVLFISIALNIILFIVLYYIIVINLVYTNFTYEAILHTVEINNNNAIVANVANNVEINYNINKCRNEIIFSIFTDLFDKLNTSTVYFPSYFIKDGNTLNTIPEKIDLFFISSNNLSDYQISEYKECIKDIQHIVKEYESRMKNILNIDLI
jgi:hypothetical protein